MIVPFDGTWEPIGSEFRDRIRDEFVADGEECFYVDMVGFRDHRPLDWHDHHAVHALYAVIPGLSYRSADAPDLREALREAYRAHGESYDTFEDERDSYADRYAIVAMRALTNFVLPTGKHVAAGVQPAR